MVIDVFGDAADSVAAHLGLGAVGVEHSHPGVGFFRGAYQNQAVGTYAGVAVTDDGGKLLGIVNLLGKAVDIDVIVAEAVHFRKAHLCNLSFETSSGSV